MAPDIAINISGVSKRFTLGAPPSSSFRDTVMKSLQLRGLNQSKQEFWALKEISFSTYRGEVIGVIGRNGAGKSTLLKILSRITRPTTGVIEINGRLSSLLEVGTGFHAELSGRENVFLNGAILGMDRKEIRSKLDAIVEYSGVREFIDTPVKHYSSGMKVRLAFSVAAHLESEILIVDEVLAVGDAEFQKKCIGTMGDVAASGRTVLFVSHNMGAVSQLCSRAILMDEGKIVFDGDVEDTIGSYSAMQDRLMSFECDTLNPDKQLQVTRVFLEDLPGKNTNSFVHDEGIILCINFHAKKIIKGLNICISVYNYLRYPIFTSDVSLTDYNVGNNQAKVLIPPNTLKAGHYSFLVAIHSPNGGVKALEFLQYICPMTIYDNGSEFSRYDGVWETGDVFVNCKWEFNF